MVVNISFVMSLELKFHWVEAGKLASKIAKSFFKDVTLKDFKTWNCRKCYTWENKGRYQFTVKIRHTKEWSCQYEYWNDIIRININDDALPDIPSVFGSKNPMWKDVFLYVLTHEITHFMQWFYNVKEKVNERELRYFTIPGNGSTTSYKNIFLYTTNYIEMDADISGLFNLINYKTITKNMLREFYSWFSCEKKEVADMVTGYVYEYWWKDNKDLELREMVENDELIITRD